MSLIDDIKKLGREAGLTESEIKELEDFVDNYIGTNDEGYSPDKEYHETHKDKLKPIWRKLKESSKYGPLVNILTPYHKGGVLTLLD